MSKVNLKYVVYHYEEFGSVESGPMGVERQEDAAFDTEGEAHDWIIKQKNPNRYDVMEVTDYPTDDDLPPWMKDVMADYEEAMADVYDRDEHLG